MLNGVNEVNGVQPTKGQAVWQDTQYQCLEGRVASVDPPSAVKLSSIEVLMEPRFTETPVHVLQMDTADAAMDLVRKGYRPLLLNMSNTAVAGGSVSATDSTSGQEESLFCRSNYFKSLLQSYYPLTGTDVVFSPQICFFKDNAECDYVDLPAGVMVDCIACPMVGDQDILKERLRMIFKTGYAYGHDVLVLSAVASAAGSSDTQDIANVYRELVDEYQGCFRAIIFAIYDTTIFSDTFYSKDEDEHSPQPPQPPQPTQNNENNEYQPPKYSPLISDGADTFSTTLNFG